MSYPSHSLELRRPLPTFTSVSSAPGARRFLTPGRRALRSKDLERDRTRHRRFKRSERDTGKAVQLRPTPPIVAQFAGASLEDQWVANVVDKWLMALSAEGFPPLRVVAISRLLLMNLSVKFDVKFR
jgi:hypothetical protein